MREYEGYEDTNIGNHKIAPAIQAGKNAEERKKMILQQPTPEQAREIEDEVQKIFSTGNAELKEALQA